MKFEYSRPDGSYRYEFVFVSADHIYKTDMVDIRSRKRGELGYNAWLHAIVNGEIIWRDDHEDFLHLTQDAKNYLTKLVKLKAFW